MLMPGDAMGMVPTPGNMVGAKSKKKINAAAAFLKFSTTLESQIKMLEITGIHPVSPNIEIPESLRQNDPLLASALDIQKHAKITYGQNQAYWFQNTTDVFTANLPRLAYGSMTPEEFCSSLSEAAQKNSRTTP
jgi:raffinose/stachyose/melibiose transport system substrate-binding protein